MKCDVISSGVGGQGILSISAIIAMGALDQGLRVKQVEEHGMAQRGATVVTHLRLSSRPIHSDLIARGTCDLIVSLEPLECLRFLPYLAPKGVVLTAVDPVTNIPNYPDLDGILESLEKLPRSHLVEASRLARQAGSALANNMVLVGAASNFLPLDPAGLERHVEQMFASKGRKVVEINLEALRAGRESLACLSS